MANKKANAEEVEAFIKEIFNEYNLNYRSFFGDFTFDGEYINYSYELDGKINKDMVNFAAFVLGVDSEDLLTQNWNACLKWNNKYSFFRYIGGFNTAVERSFYNSEEEFMNERMLAVIFGRENCRPQPDRYNGGDMARRLVCLLKELDKTVPGTYHKGARITHLYMEYDNFCHYDNIENLLKSFLQMTDRTKELFCKALSSELDKDERNEYNFLVSVLNLKDNISGITMYYDNIKSFADIYKDEGLREFEDMVFFHHHTSFEPWRCVDFAKHKEFAQRYINVFPDSKKKMQDFLMKVKNIKCYFEWSDSPEIRDEFIYYGPDGEPLPDEPVMRERTQIYLPKTAEELRDDYMYVDDLSNLCSPPSMGGLTVPDINPYALRHKKGALNKLRERAIRRVSYDNFDKWYLHKYKKQFVYTSDDKNGGTDE